MKFPEFKYVEIAIGGYNKRGRVIERQDLSYSPSEATCYATFFRFDDYFLKYWESNSHSVAGFKGECYSDYLPIDLDRDDPSKSLSIAGSFLCWLECQFDMPMKALGLFFSGSKGFHIEIPVSLLGDIEPSPNLPRKFRSLVASLGDWGFDMNIYQANRLWRMENSRHPNTGLYKVRLSPTQLLSLSIDEIREVARAPSKANDYPDYDDWLPVPEFSQLWASLDRTESQFDIPDSPDFLKKGIYKGERNNRAFQYAKKLKSQGYSQDEAVDLLSSWNSKNRPPLHQRELDRTIQSVYSFAFTNSESESLLHHLRNDLIYRDLSAKERDVYMAILCHVNTEQKDWLWDGHYYRCEPGEMVFSYRKFHRTNQCASIVGEQTIRTTLGKLHDIGRIEITNLGKRKGSKLRILSNTLTNTPEPESP